MSLANDCGCSPPNLALSLFGQPSDDVALLDRLHGPRTEFGKELINPKPEFIGLLLAVLRLTVCESIVTKLAESHGLCTQILRQFLSLEFLRVALSKKFLGSAVCPGFLASLATVLIGPPNPPDAAVLHSLKNAPPTCSTTNARIRA